MPRSAIVETGKSYPDPGLTSKREDLEGSQAPGSPAHPLCHILTVIEAIAWKPFEWVSCPVF
ncbi:hypothetical protein ASPCADRAFT_204915 [Aspergillus carbonarius ITEM 5010]|uniref:Uncharacterized protein n=1 Tax=Aspergillus carbonarius (strain ITEM 5010) TaxID=602072 RepID=A0A1R3RXR6_ASPC5|nr:hypothetical protein ASPCADRAFT_204915 [Aspergillus carbonarius ITEM 5010]